MKNPLYAPSYFQKIPEYNSLLSLYWDKILLLKQKYMQRAYKIAPEDAVQELEADVRIYLSSVFELPGDFIEELIDELPYIPSERRDALVSLLSFFIVLEKNNLQEIFKRIQ